jgi:hypothetical protein
VGCRLVKPDSKTNACRKVLKPEDKIFVLMNEACSDHPQESPDHAIRSEMNEICRLATRILSAIGMYCIHMKYLQASVHAFMLSKCLTVRLWEGSYLVSRQLKGVSRNAPGWRLRRLEGVRLSFFCMVSCTAST